MCLFFIYDGFSSNFVWNCINMVIFLAKLLESWLNRSKTNNFLKYSYLLAADRMARRPKTQHSGGNCFSNEKDSSKFLNVQALHRSKFNNCVRFQYESKVQNTKKTKVLLQISVDGIQISLKKKKRRVSDVSLTLAYNLYQILLSHRKNNGTQLTTSQSCPTLSIEFFMFPTTVMILKYLVILREMAAVTHSNVSYSKPIIR